MFKNACYLCNENNNSGKSFRIPLVGGTLSNSIQVQWTPFTIHNTSVITLRCVWLQQTTGQLYALAMGWFNQWEAYILGHSLEAPGPIDNSPLSIHNPSQKLGKNHTPCAFKTFSKVWKYRRPIRTGRA